MAYACRTSSCRQIVGVLPYLPYSKQSKMRKRGSIASRLIATMLSKAGNRKLPLILPIPHNYNAVGLEQTKCS